VLAGVYGKTVLLADNTTAVADDNYIRESILNPQAKIAQGFAPVMPTFQGQVSEDDLLKLLAYIKSLGVQQAAPTPAVESPRSLVTSAGSPTNPGAQPPGAATTTTQNGQQP
jgi:cytochrome c oxidase subunit 2